MLEPIRIDLSAIDRAGFKVVEDGGRVLVIPLKSKQIWREDELHLRSLVTDRQGRVLSAGFPKFFNYGENAAHDALFVAAVRRDAVEFLEKLDGTLVIADAPADGRGPARLRTRGQTTLGKFAPEVAELLAQRHPRLLDALAAEPIARDHSVLFEYVSPRNHLVVRYDEPALYLLGVVSHARVSPRWDRDAVASLAERLGVPTPPVYALPTDPDAAIAAVRGWKGKEGVVARTVTPDGRPLLIKIKAEDYLRLDTFRSRLTTRRAQRLAYLLGITRMEDALARLAPYGCDFEAVQYLAPDLRAYFTARAEAMAAYASFREIVAAWIGTGEPPLKRAYVERVRELMARDPRFGHAHWLRVATKLFDGHEPTARAVLEARALDEEPNALLAWQQDPDAEIRAIFGEHAPAED